MRIRTIKPEFWRSDDITRLSREHRLLFIGLWQYVDDNGVGIDDYRQIAAELFALEDDQNDVRTFIREGLATLSRGLLIYRYEIDGRHYLQVRNFKRHQRVDKPNKPRYPEAPPDHKPPTSESAPVSGDSREALATPSRASRETLEPGQTGQSQISGVSRLALDPPIVDAIALTSDSGDPRETLAPVTEEQRNRGEGKDTPSLRSERVTTRPSPRGLDRFPAFYDAYPRHVGRRDAEKAWTAAMKRGVDSEHAIRAARRYADECRGREARFVAHPATWLNQGRYDDAPVTEHANGHREPSRAQEWLALGEHDGPEVLDFERREIR